jgi:hypothetical protein
MAPKLQAAAVFAAIGCELASDEMVLRGGYLAQPVVLTRLTQVCGRKFVPLWKVSPELAVFLTGQKPSAAKLKDVNCFDEMRRVVRNVCEATIKEIKNTGEVLAAEDLTAKLGLDTEHQASGRAANSRHCRARRVTKNQWKMLPEFAVVPMQIAGCEPGWAPFCLLTPEAKAVAMEATLQNFEALFKFVQVRLNECELSKKERAPAVDQPTSRNAAGKEPYDSPKGRVYHVKSKGWVRCVKKTPSPADPKKVAGKLSQYSRSFRRLSPKKKQKVPTKISGTSNGDGEVEASAIVFDEDIF